MPKPIREVKAYRFYYKCGHKGVAVARERGPRGEQAAKKQAERMSQYPCWPCERDERGD